MVMDLRSFCKEQEVYTEIKEFIRVRLGRIKDRAFSGYCWRQKRLSIC
jgi:hypothetical protein